MDLYLPTVCVGDPKPTCHAWSPHDAYGFQTEAALPEPIDDISETLPCHHLDEGIGDEIGKASVGV